MSCWRQGNRTAQAVELAWAVETDELRLHFQASAAGRKVSRIRLKTTARDSEKEMNTLMVGYDLNKPGADYSDLISYLKGLGAWWHHLDSTWLIKSSETPKQVRDGAMEFLDKNDDLLVLNVTDDDWAAFGFNQAGNDWLRDNI